MNIMSYIWGSNKPSTETSKSENITIQKLFKQFNVEYYTILNPKGSSSGTRTNDCLRFLLEKEAETGKNCVVSSIMRTQCICELFSKSDEQLYGFISIRKWADILNSCTVWKKDRENWVKLNDEQIDIIDQFGNPIDPKLPLISLDANQCYLRIPIDNRHQSIVLEISYSLLSVNVRNKLNQSDIVIDLEDKHKHSICNGQLISNELDRERGAYSSCLIFENGLEFNNISDKDTYIKIHDIKNANTNGNVHVAKKYKENFVKLNQLKPFRLNYKKGTPYIINFSVMYVDKTVEITKESQIEFIKANATLNVKKLN